MSDGAKGEGGGDQQIFEWLGETHNSMLQAGLDASCHLRLEKGVGLNSTLGVSNGAARYTVQKP
ncbi:hypothetical protein D3C85_1500400 [compost metagenome]